MRIQWFFEAILDWLSSDRLSDAVVKEIETSGSQYESGQTDDQQKTRYHKKDVGCFGPT